MIKVVIFDLDDTLYNEREFVYSGFMEVAKYLSRITNEDYKKVNEEILDIFYKNGRGKVFDIFCNKYDIDEDIEKLVNIYRENIPKIKLYDDAIYELERLKDNYSLGIITDGEKTVQWNKIDALGVKKYMDKIIVTDDIGRNYWKPNEGPYIEMLDYFGGNFLEYIYIGDNPHKDFISAKKLGMHTIRIIRKKGDHMRTFLSEEYEADYTINSLREVEEIINLINEKS